MIDVRQTETFRRWLAGLRDVNAVARIVARLDRTATGNLGDWKTVGGGVSEMLIAYGPGYRLYFIRRGAVVIVMLGGGTKGTQAGDIRRAVELAAQLKG